MITVLFALMCCTALAWYPTYNYGHGAGYHGAAGLHGLGGLHGGAGLHGLYGGSVYGHGYGYGYPGYGYGECIVFIIKLISTV